MSLSKIKPVDYDLFCYSDIISKLHEKRDQVAKFPIENYHLGFLKSNPFGLLGKAGFVDEFAVHLAFLDSACEILPTTGSFVDISGNKEGFSDYILWKSKMNGIISLMNESGRLPKMDRLMKYTSATQNILDSENANLFVDFILKNSKADDISLILASRVRFIFLKCKENLGFRLHAHGEFYHRQILVWESLIMFKTLKKGGHFVLKTMELLSTFSVGIFYILYRYFDSIAIVKPLSSHSSLSERFIICKGLKESHPDFVIRHLESVLHSMNSNATKAIEKIIEANLEDVESVVDLDLITSDEDFLDYLQGSNMKVSIKQTEALQELQEYSFGYRLNEFDQAKIRWHSLQSLRLPQNQKV
jgi:cap1 methyltransferase